jgi:hypothetical protein
VGAVPGRREDATSPDTAVPSTSITLKTQVRSTSVTALTRTSRKASVSWFCALHQPATNPTRLLGRRQEPKYDRPFQAATRHPRLAPNTRGGDNGHRDWMTTRRRRYRLSAKSFPAVHCRHRTEDCAQNRRKRRHRRTAALARDRPQLAPPRLRHIAGPYVKALRSIRRLRLFGSRRVRVILAPDDKGLTCAQRDR